MIFVSICTLREWGLGSCCHSGEIFLNSFSWKARIPFTPPPTKDTRIPNTREQKTIFNLLANDDNEAGCFLLLTETLLQREDKATEGVRPNYEAVVDTHGETYFPVLCMLSRQVGVRHRMA